MRPLPTHTQLPTCTLIVTTLEKSQGRAVGALYTITAAEVRTSLSWSSSSHTHTSTMLSDEVIVAIALGLPALIVAVLALWVAYLTYNGTRLQSDHHRTHTPERIPSWPSLNRSIVLPAVAEYDLPAFPGTVRRRI
jgi:hypothetical protein